MCITAIQSKHLIENGSTSISPVTCVGVRAMGRLSMRLARPLPSRYRTTGHTSKPRFIPYLANGKNRMKRCMSSLGWACLQHPAQKRNSPRIFPISTHAQPCSQAPQILVFGSQNRGVSSLRYSIWDRYQALKPSIAETTSLRLALQFHYSGRRPN